MTPIARALHRQTPAERLATGTLDEFPIEVQGMFWLTMMGVAVRLASGVAPKAGK